MFLKIENVDIKEFLFIENIEERESYGEVTTKFKFYSCHMIMKEIVCIEFLLSFLMNINNLVIDTNEESFVLTILYLSDIASLCFSIFTVYI